MMEIKSNFYQRHKRERKKKKSYCLNSTCVDKCFCFVYSIKENSMKKNLSFPEI